MNPSELDLYLDNIVEYLYHATFTANLKNIKKYGLGGKTNQLNWSDSLNDRVYLTIDAEMAYDFIMSIDNEDINDELFDDITILKIDIKDLDKSKLFLDSNIIDNSGYSFEYHDIISKEKLIIHKRIREN